MNFFWGGGDTIQLLLLLLLREASVPSNKVTEQTVFQSNSAYVHIDTLLQSPSEITLFL